MATITKHRARLPLATGIPTPFMRRRGTTTFYCFDLPGRDGKTITVHMTATEYAELITTWTRYRAEFDSKYTAAINVN